MVEYKIGSKGKRVTELQEALIAHGYSLPKWGADGELGWETWLALLAFAQGRGLAQAWPNAETGVGAVPELVVASLFEAVDDGPPALIDLTRLHKLEKGTPYPRAPATITGIVLHQTATRLGNKHARWYNVACHVGIPPSGEILYVNDILAYVWHANGANRFSIGIEIDGRFEGVKGVRKTLWRYKDGQEPDVLSAKQIAAARSAITWLVAHAKERSCSITHIYAHRQFSDQRRSDPGSAIWKEVGVWAQNEVGLQLKSRPDFTLDTGMPLPVEWDPAGSVDYYGRKK